MRPPGPGRAPRTHLAQSNKVHERDAEFIARFASLAAAGSQHCLHLQLAGASPRQRGPRAFKAVPAVDCARAAGKAPKGREHGLGSWRHVQVVSCMLPL